MSKEGEAGSNNDDLKTNHNNKKQKIKQNATDRQTVERLETEHANCQVNFEQKKCVRTRLAIGQ